MTPLFDRKKRGHRKRVAVDARDGPHRVTVARDEIRDGRGTLVHRMEHGDPTLVRRIREELLLRPMGDSRISESRVLHEKRASRDVVKSWSFKTDVIVMSETFERGVVGVGPKALEEIHARSGVRVIARHAGHSKSMRLRMSPRLRGFEVELTESDIEELEISDGVNSYLEVMSGESALADADPKAVWARPRGAARQPPRRARAATRHRIEIDND